MNVIKSGPEAKSFYESGEKLYLEGDMIKSAEAAQREAMEIV